MEIIFYHLANEFEDKSYFFDDLEVEVKSLYHEDIGGLKKNIGRPEVENVQLTNEVSHLQASIDDLREQDSHFQEYNNRLFDACQTLK